MSWPLLLIAVPTLCYAGAAVAYGLRQEWPNVVIFTGYALANCGFLAVEIARMRG
jgi:hypothetical protein